MTGLPQVSQLLGPTPRNALFNKKKIYKNLWLAGCIYPSYLNFSMTYVGSVGFQTDKIRRRGSQPQARKKNGCYVVVLLKTSRKWTEL